MNNQDSAPVCPNCKRPLPPKAPEGLCPECLMKAGWDTGAEIPAGEHTAEPKGFVPPSVEELSRFFPQLDIIELLGQGGMGAVYKACQKQLDRVVALKILPPNPNRGEAFAERFVREARALAKLAHPHIVTLYEFGQVDGLFYFLMEYVDGLSLRQLLERGRVSAREALAIVPQICEALQYAHDRGIVHRDIKPGNILLNREGQVKIADFGVAKLMTGDSPRTAASGPAVPAASLTQAGEVVGTPQYMAPEQVEHPLAVDHRADIYSLGVVFYQMLTGELPSGGLIPPSRKVQIDVRLDEVVLRALEEEPERRYQQAREVKTQLETIPIPTAAGQSRPEETVPVPAGAPPRLSRLAVMGAVWAACFFAAKTFALLGKPLPGGYGPLREMFLTLGLSGYFGTTVLGWMAVAQIRRAGGRLYGLGLALADGLLFPLLTLALTAYRMAAEILGGLAKSWLNQHHLHRTLWNDVVPFGIALGTLALIIVAGCWVVRFARRLVNRTASSHADQETIGLWGSWRWAVLAVLVGAASLLGVTIGMPNQTSLAEGRFGFSSLAARVFAPWGHPLTPVKHTAEDFIKARSVWDSVEDSRIRVDLAISEAKDTNAAISAAAEMVAHLQAFDQLVKGTGLEVISADLLAQSAPLCQALDRGQLEKAAGLTRKIKQIGMSADVPLVLAAFARKTKELEAGAAAPGSAGPEATPAGTNTTPQKGQAPAQTTGPNTNAISASESTSREVLLARLSQAEHAVALMQSRVNVGTATPAELAAAQDQVAILQAELANEPVKVAEARLAAAEHQFKFAKSRYDAGLIPVSEYAAAEDEVKVRQAELAAARAQQKQ